MKQEHIDRGDLYLALDNFDFLILKMPQLSGRGFEVSYHKGYQVRVNTPATR